MFFALKLGAKKSTQTFFVQSFSTTLRVMDVRAENRGRPHEKVRFPAAPVVGRNCLTPGHSGVRVRNVRRKSGPKSLCLCCFFFPEKLSFSLVVGKIANRQSLAFSEPLSTLVRDKGLTGPETPKNVQSTENPKDPAIVKILRS